MRVIIVHGWDGGPEKDWMPWLKAELEKHNIEVIVPKMPTEVPVMKEWVPFLSKVIGKPDETTFLVGHSAGCITILRYLEQIDERIAGAVLVAGFTDDLGFKELHNYFETLILWKVIKEHCKKFVAISSDTDKFVPLKHSYVLKEKLSAELIIQHNAGHFSDADKIKELPVALEALLEMMKE